ncbi:hypothetical protein [Dictyobacter kobayashii]|uniref:Uncharacterized protein n=1 Tax=Dictyobacter kobayashii TaxID=2014872 RepID=A0A402ANW7_9CHLR|nr:hypothetical protein [Dictyobacter kobayashii]GCE20888.1 hypothetical protein KDK_46880 [Dictyobacter kobayashii]
MNTTLPASSVPVETSDSVERPLPFSLLFAETPPCFGPRDESIYPTAYKSNRDGKEEDDETDDTDDPDEIPDQTGLIADSNTREDDDY